MKQQKKGGGGSVILHVFHEMNVCKNQTNIKIGDFSGVLTANFDLYTALMATELLVFFSVPQQL